MRPRLKAVSIAAQGHNRADPLERKTKMHREDLMNADMLSENPAAGQRLRDFRHVVAE
jgi:hypothetical protein